MNIGGLLAALTKLPKEAVVELDVYLDKSEHIKQAKLSAFVDGTVYYIGDAFTIDKSIFIH